VLPGDPASDLRLAGQAAGREVPAAADRDVGNLWHS
jgi:hypothetical protein